MCLWAQGIDNKNDGISGGRRARGFSNDDRGVGRGQGIGNASEGLETTTEAARIWVQQNRLRRCNDRPEEFVATTEASAERNEPEELTTTMETSAEEAEETTRLSEHL